MMNNLNGSSCWGTESNINIEGGPYGTHEYCSKAFERLNMLLEKAKTILHMGHKYECLMVRIYPTPKKTYTEKDTTEKMK